MDKAASWLRKIKLALSISIVTSFVYAIVSYFYVTNMAETGVDPLGEQSQWNVPMVILYSSVSLVGIPAAVFLFVASIGFMFRSAQWLKGMDATAIDGKPGLIIAAYFIPIADLIFPWRYMQSMNKAGANSDAEKSKLGNLIKLNLALGVLALLAGGNQWADIILGAPQQTIDEVVFQEWRGIIGTLFDIGAMTALYFIVTPLFAGLEKRSK